jgi:hypothetical protein
VCTSVTLAWGPVSAGVDSANHHVNGSNNWFVADRAIYAGPYSLGACSVTMTCTGAGKAGLA